MKKKSSSNQAKEICSTASVSSAFHELRPKETIMSSGDKHLINIGSMPTLSFLPPTVATKCEIRDLSSKNQLLSSAKIGLAPLEPLSINHGQMSSLVAKNSYHVNHHHPYAGHPHVYAPQPRRDPGFSPPYSHYYFPSTTYHTAEHPVTYPISPPRTPFYHPSVERSFSPSSVAKESPNYMITEKHSPKYEQVWNAKSSADISPPPSSSGSEYEASYEYVHKKLQGAMAKNAANAAAAAALAANAKSATKANSKKEDGGETPPRYQCSDCKKSYSTLSGLTKHQEFHCSSQAKKSFSCKHCVKTYISLGALKMHIRTHTLPCKCKICGKAFR